MESTMILIGLGANLDSRFGSPRATMLAAMDAMPPRGIRVTRRSSWYESAPVPASDQPWYVNAVAEVETLLPPLSLLAALQEIEREFGRVRTLPNAPRLLDLDILDYDGQARDDPELRLPHPRLHERAFVLLPLQELAPAWRHPISGEGVDALISGLPPGQRIRRVPAD